MRKEKLEELQTYIKEFQTKKKEIVALDSNKKNFMTVEKYRYYLNNGKVLERENIKKNGKDGSAAIIVPITKQNTTILVVEPRVLTKRGVGVAFPAGYIEENEEPYISAKRELREETGYEPEKDEDITLLKRMYQDEGCSRALNYIYLMRNCVKKYPQKLDKDEFIKYFECTFAEALELEKMGYIENANSIIALDKAKSLVLK